MAASSSTGWPNSKRRAIGAGTGTARAGFDDFIAAFADWSFDWLDVPAMIRGAQSILEFPMVDRDPLPRWSFDA